MALAISISLKGGASGVKIAIIHDWLIGMRGGEKVLECLCELYPDAHLYTLFHVKRSVSKTIEAHAIKTSFVERLPFLKRFYRYYLPLYPLAIEGFELKDYDVVVSLSHCVAKGVIPAECRSHSLYLYPYALRVGHARRVFP